MPGQPEHADGGEPHGHDRSEQLADPRAALRLQAEHCNQDDNRQRQYIGREFRNRRLDALSALNTEIAGVMAPSP